MGPGPGLEGLQAKGIFGDQFIVCIADTHRNRFFVSYSDGFPSHGLNGENDEVRSWERIVHTGKLFGILSGRLLGCT